MSLARRLAAAALSGLMLFSVAERAIGQTDFSGDRAGAAQLMQNFTTQALPAVHGSMYGRVDTAPISTMGATGQQGTVASHNESNLAAIQDCQNKANANWVGVDEPTKLKCQAVLTAAFVLYTPNPYLDHNSPQNLDNDGTAAQMRAAERSQRTAAVSGSDANVRATAAGLTSTTSCQDVQTTTPAIMRRDQCRIEKPVVPSPCINTVSATIVDGVVRTTESPLGCAANTQNPYCEVTGSDCAAELPVVVSYDDQGEPVTAPYCAQKQYSYDCWQPDAEWDTTKCDVLNANPACTPTDNVTPIQSIAGRVVFQDLEYSCVMTPESTSSVSGCNTHICLGPSCFDVTSNTDTADLAAAAVGLETIREAGVYANGTDPESLHIFAGLQGNCSYPVGPMRGLGSNCCNSSAGAVQSNRSILPSLGTQAIGNAVSATGAYGLHQASNYMYDFMFTTGNDWMVERAMNAWSAGTWNPSSGFSMSGLSMYGFSMNIASAGSTAAAGVATDAATGAAVQAAGGTAGGAAAGGVSSLISSVLPNGASQVLSSISTAYNAATVQVGSVAVEGFTLNFSFNPYMLAAMVAVQVITELMSCGQDEQFLSMRKGADLCFQTGGGCSSRLPRPFRTCIRWTETWCCMNSKLAKLIGQQGGLQLSGAYRCGGFTPAELRQIDFARIDFSSFTADAIATARAALPDATYNVSTVNQASNRAAAARAGISPGGVAGTMPEQVNGMGLQDYAAGMVSEQMSR